MGIGDEDLRMKASTLAGKWDEANQIGYYGSTFIRIHKMPSAGDVHEGHQHNFDHVSIVAQGGIRVRWRKYKDGNPNDELLAMGEKEFMAPTFAIIDKELWHEVTAIEDGTVWMCVYALPDGFYGDPSPFCSERNNPYL